MKLASLILSSVLSLASVAMGATPKAYLRGPTEAKADQPVLLKFAGTASDREATLEQVSGPERLVLYYLYDRDGKPIYVEATASVPGLYRFCLIAEGTPDGADKPIRSYAFWDMTVVGDEKPTPDDGDDAGDGVGVVKAPSEIIPLAIGRPSEEYRLDKGQPFVRFSFTPKARKTFTISTSGNGAWKMELSGPDDPGNVFARDNRYSGVGTNAKITAVLSPGGTYFVKVRPALPYFGKAFRVSVLASQPPPGPTPVPPTPVPPTPTPVPPTPVPVPPVPSGELKVLFLQESEGPMSEAQLQVWHSGMVEEALVKNTTPGSDGVPGYRKWDDDQDASDDAPEWSEMLSVAKAEIQKTGTPLPVVVVFRGGKGTLKPLPTSVQDMLTLIQK